MDSCGKDASGNTPGLQMSFKTSGNLLELYDVEQACYFILGIFYVPL